MDEQPEVETGEPLRVLIVDDHALFRRGLELVLSQEDDIDVVGEATDGDAAVESAESLGPDVILMDVRMPGTSGIDAARKIREQHPATKILMLTVSDDERDLFDSVLAGADGYLLKEVSIEDVADAVRAVARGHGLVSPSLTPKLLSEFNAVARRAEDRRLAHTPRLTAREVEVLKLVAKGESNREIAEHLYIAENTVKNHIRNILEKLGLHSRMEAVVYALREKLLEIE
ncbi:MAG: response regulator transcription factor [Acidimicrobiia bacterium]